MLAVSLLAEQETCVCCATGNLKLAAVLGGAVSSVVGELGAEGACMSTLTSLAFSCSSFATLPSSGHMKQMMLWYGRNCMCEYATLVHA